MTFEDWAKEIDARVAAALPGVNAKLKIDDLCRWIHNGKECQVHALSDSVAALIALRRNGIITDCSFSCRIAIAPHSEEQVACSIIGWLGA
ncbi:MAG TPA: hypothetical protein VJP85_14350 [Candidatus Baltobacteraceae bacterium]|nr:hypothetical protein [Candidatus Baltobacteraceae bacterium]